LIKIFLPVLVCTCSVGSAGDSVFDIGARGSEAFFSSGTEILSKGGLVHPTDASRGARIARSEGASKRGDEYDFSALSASTPDEVQF
jgi:hypothetical protein